MVWLLGEYAWYGQRSGFGTHPVGEKRPNAWELYDVHGNVWEWGQDAWHFDYSGAPSDGSAWTDGGTGAGRVVRGGSWVVLAGGCRSAYRGWTVPDFRDFSLGFRCARAQA